MHDVSGLIESCNQGRDELLEKEKKRWMDTFKRRGDTRNRLFKIIKETV